MILELADEYRSDFEINRNTTDFTFSSYKQTKIVTVKEYLETYKRVGIKIFNDN